MMVTSGWMTARSVWTLTSAALISTTAAQKRFVSTPWGAGGAVCLDTSWGMITTPALILTSVSLTQVQSVLWDSPASTLQAVSSVVRTDYGRAPPTPPSAWTAVCPTMSSITSPSAVSSVLREPGPAQRDSDVPPATSWRVSVTLMTREPV